MIPADSLPPGHSNMMITLDLVEKMPSPRVIKSHLPFYLLNPKLLDTCKEIYFLYVFVNGSDWYLLYFLCRWCM